jgi:hypothetical protein
MKKLELVDDVQDWKRWWSMRWIIATAFFTSIIATYALLPADWLPQIAPAVKQALAVGALLSAGAAGVSRVLKQPQAA